MGKAIQVNGTMDPKREMVPGLAQQVILTKANGSQAKPTDMANTLGQTGIGMKEIGRTVSRKESGLNTIAKQRISIEASSNAVCHMDMGFTNIKTKQDFWENLSTVISMASDY